MGDVAAKSESQGSVGVLSGYAAGVGLLTVSHSAPYLYTIFALSIPIHLLITQWMLSAATFELLTLPRLSFLARDFASHAGRPGAERGLLTLRELEERRGLGAFGEYFKTKEDKYVQIGPSLEAIVTPTDLGARIRWDVCVEAFNVRDYGAHSIPPLTCLPDRASHISSTHTYHRKCSARLPSSCILPPQSMTGYNLSCTPHTCSGTSTTSCKSTLPSRHPKSCSTTPRS